MLWFIPGLIALIFGAELMVRGASKLALSFGISPLVVGLTVVAFGTSSPELAVSVQSAWSGQVDIALGNVVGSNIFNVLFILGLSALIAPLLVHRQLIRQEVPMMVAFSLLLWVLASDSGLSRGDGLLLVSLLLAYTVLVIRQSRRDNLALREIESELPAVDDRAWDAHWLMQILLVAAGMGLLVVGSNWLVEAAVTLARQLGMSEVVVGLTIVAAGTSLPEVATSVMAAIRGQRDIAVGNVVGSNIFNILAVLGISASIAPGDLLVPASLLAFDLPVMVAIAVACLPIFFTGHLIARWEGALFLAYYAAYTTYLVLDAAGHAAQSGFSMVMGGFALPLTAITLIVLAWRHRHGARNDQASDP
ncbi:MAG: Inner membrane protein YrbG [Candidatus Accumulibacter appositus]|uniref:Inner membrane protein YrbG n=1 Tax=Candidatus Accumulibacter appositus TaxID=1454003 RepID=A0A011N4X1_9PROT|nr:calcium/sodium antiporter [Accumulibacter sp.]EXI77608.1 MAG: Inner membrane protein YrbG [Candidatus Accumulibacter appositus]HRF03936.1 calcium/sodium antiporter [Accumulibacter sp.]